MRVALGMLVAFGVAAIVLFAVVMSIYRDTPDVYEMQHARNAQASIVYTADGKELTRFYDEHRIWVDLDGISPHVVAGLIASEDRRFYEHGGVDWRRAFGAVYQTVRGSQQGGSTITMQLARNAYPEIRREPMYARKIKEWALAHKLEAHYPKDRLIELYLNTVPFNYNTYGIEAASQVYFGENARDLDPRQSATLVAMLRGPSYYNPVRHADRNERRRNLVLAQMRATGRLGEAAFYSARRGPTELHFQRPSRTDNSAPYFAEHVRQWLEAWAVEAGYDLYTDGLRVHTTLDTRLQTVAEEAVRTVGDELQAVAGVEWSRASSPLSGGGAERYVRQAERVQPFAYFWRRNAALLDRFIAHTPEYRELVGEGLSEEAALVRLRGDADFVEAVKTRAQRLDAGLVVMHPKTGHVLAWAGGRDFGTNEYDHVGQAKRQPGSTFKPFVYAAALEHGYGMNDLVVDRVRTYRDASGGTWRPTNAGGGATGRLYTLRDALAYSKNTVTAQLTNDVGPHRVASVARRMGVTSELREVPSIGLGTNEVTLLEMTAAYSTLANGGIHNDPVVVTRIETPDGRTVARFSGGNQRVLGAHTTYTLVEMMRGVTEYGTARSMRARYGYEGDAIAKTGTTQNGADGWFMLANPELVVGAWTGFTTPSVAFRSNYWGQGAHNALPIVARFYENAPEGTFSARARFEKPAGYVTPSRPSMESYRVASQRYGSEEYDDEENRPDGYGTATGYGARNYGGTAYGDAESLNSRAARSPDPNAYSRETARTIRRTDSLLNATDALLERARDRSTRPEADAPAPQRQPRAREWAVFPARRPAPPPAERAEPTRPAERPAVRPAIRPTVRPTVPPSSESGGTTGGNGDQH